VKNWRFFGAGLVAMLGPAGLGAPVPDVVITRPGQIAIASITGEVAATVAGQRRTPKVDDRVRADTVVTTGRKSLVSLAFSNGVVLELGPESELEVEEFFQAPFAGSPKLETMKAEPSVSRARVRLVGGELRLAVKPLQVARGSWLVVSLPAGNARIDEGSFYAMVRMTDAGIGMCAIELERGTAEFELAGAAYAKVPAGRRLAFAVEIDRGTGAVKVGEMPKAGRDGPP
jgi:hypothetical protein